MTRRHLPVVAAIAAAAVLGVTSSARAAEVDHKRLIAADKNPADWLTYHGTYKSWHYSGLDQINSKNIRNLKVAWSHVTPKSTRGLQSFPLVADGILYYSGSHNQVFALDGGQLHRSSHHLSSRHGTSLTPDSANRIVHGSLDRYLSPKPERLCPVAVRPHLAGDDESAHGSLD